MSIIKQREHLLFNIQDFYFAFESTEM